MPRIQSVSKKTVDAAPQEVRPFLRRQSFKAINDNTACCELYRGPLRAEKRSHLALGDEGLHGQDT